MSILKDKSHIHFIGIGGIGMSAIAYLYQKLGHSVSGSDEVANYNTKVLESTGVKFSKGHSAHNLSSRVDLVVTNSAIRASNPELVEARRLGLRLVKRAEILSFLSNNKKTVAVAGSHGKTTTSCYLSEVLLNLGEEPGFAVGGILKKTRFNARLGEDRFVIEADESDSSFHYFKNEYGIITNLDNDHVDNYGSFENLTLAFLKFCNESCKKNIVNLDDKILAQQLKNIQHYVSFGQDPRADYSFRIVRMQFGCTNFELKFQEESHPLTTNVTGEFNISNLVGVIAYLLEEGFLIDKIKEAIRQIEGVKRRYDILHKSDSLVVIDDYAHHPTEISQLIKNVKLDYPGHEVITFFEPHRFTRTRNFWTEFQECFGHTDKLYLLPVYAASEDEITGVSSAILFDDIKLKEKILLSSLGDIKGVIEAQDAHKRVIISLGAGPISQCFREIYHAENI